VVGVAADTLWRWQLQPDFEDPPLQTLLANIVRYLAPPPHRQAGTPFTTLRDASPQVGQEAVLATTLKDKNYDPVRDAELDITVSRPDGTQQHIYPRDLPEQPGYYEYRVPLAMPGAYDVVAEYGKQRYETGFVVGAAASEFANLSANRSAVTDLAEATGGQVIGDIETWLETVPRAASTRQAVRELQVWNSPAVVVLFLLLLCADCYLRKRQGLA